MTYFYRTSKDFNFSRKGYDYNFSPEADPSFPLSSFSTSHGFYASLTPTLDVRSIYMPKSHHLDVFNGFRVIFHDPYELPSKASVNYFATIDKPIKFWISPEVATIDESLMSLTPEE